MNARLRDSPAHRLGGIAQSLKQVINKIPTKIDRAATQKRFLI
jgi:hypothetical protein